VILWKSEGLTVPEKLWKQSGGKEPWFRQAFEEEEERGNWMSLETPEKLRDLRRKLYVKAKEEPGYRFYSLYDKVYRKDILAHACKLAKANGGTAGADGADFGKIEEEGLEKWLKGLEEELRTQSYRPQAVKRVWIPKSDGRKRPLGIPTIRDRVVQTAAVLVLEPIFEADFPEEMYGYRPRRSALDAVKQVHEGLKAGVRRGGGCRSFPIL